MDATAQTERVGTIGRPLHRYSGNFYQFTNLSKEMTMKLKPTLAASLFAIAAVLSFNANAASDTPADAKAAADTPGDTKAAAEKAAPQKKMKPHSHLQEKTGFAPNVPEAMPDKPNAAKDRTKHFHPRDGK